MPNAAFAPGRLRGALLVSGIMFALMALTGCVPSDDSGSPVKSEAPSASPSESPTASPTTKALVLPESCKDLVSTSWIKANFGDAVEPIPFDPSSGGPVSQDFVSRGGIVCFWGIPQSDGGFTLSIAERATANDAAQISTWAAEGFLLGPDFLDACWYQRGATEVGDHISVYVLVDGYEIQTSGFGTELDPYLSLIRQATDSMGYL